MSLWPKIATALLYFAVAASAVALARRAVRPISRAAAMALVLVPLAFTGRALFSGQVFAPYDIAYGSEPLSSYRADYGIGNGRGEFHDLRAAIIPWQKAVRWAIGQGEWPLWNPFILCGDPLAASAQPAPYYPPNLLAMLLPLPWSLTFGASAQFLLALLGAFLYLRELGCREQTALVGATGWCLSTFIAFWIEWPLGAALSLAPLLLLAVRRLVAEPGARSAGLLVVALLLPALAGHPESLVHLVVLGTLVGVAEVWRTNRSSAGAGPRRAAAVGWAAGAGAVSFGLAAIFLLPIFEVLPQTAEWGYRRAATALHAGRPFAESANHLARSLLPSKDTNASAFFTVPWASAYAGSVLWAPIVYGLWRARPRARTLCAILGLFGLLAGARAPVLSELLGSLPLLGVSLNERLVFVGVLALTALAALGLEAWMEREGGRGLGAIAAAVAGGSLLLVLVFARGPGAAGIEAAAFRSWALWWILPLIASAALLLLCARAPHRGVLGLLVLLLVQRFGEVGSLYPILPAEAFYPRVPPLDALPASDQPYRVVGHQYAMGPNDATLWELEDPRGYQAIHHRRFAETVPLWSIADPVSYNRAADLTRPFLSFLNVRFALATPEYRAKGWRRAGRARNAVLLANPAALPRAFLPKRVRLRAGAEATLREMAVERDFGRVAWIEPPAARSEAPRARVERRNGTGSVSIQRQGTGLLLSADLDAGGWVVISETAWHGWRASLRGDPRRELPLGFANHAFLALHLPAGQHQVDLFYRPRAFEIGRWVSAATLGLVGLLALVARRRRRSAKGESRPQEPPRSGIRRVGDRIAVPGEYQYSALHRGPAPQRFWHDAKLSEALALLDLSPGMRVLDAGCGSGLMADRAAAAGAEVLGIDANPAAIDFAVRTFARPGLAFHLGLLDELELPAAYFDRVVFLEVIEHLGRKQGEEILAAFFGLLAPGGRLVLSTPNRNSLWPLLEWLLDRLRLVPALAGEQHETLYSLPELETSALAQGFRVADRRMVNTLAPWVAWISRRWADRVHAWEIRHIRRRGSIMLLALEKPKTAGG